MFGVAGAAASDSYRLLRLGGTWVKWGDPVLGTRATVSYAPVARHTAFPGARNCKAMDSLAGLLSGSGIAAGTFRNELRAAFAAWSRAIAIDFVRADSVADADILIGMQAAPRGRAYTDVAHGAPGPDGTSSIRRSLICLNPDITWKVGFGGNADVYDLRYTLIHEIGHAIGLDHPGPTGQIMSFQYHEEFRIPQTGDVHGASQLYGRRDGADVVHAGAEEGAGGVPNADDARPEDSPLLSLGEKETRSEGAE